MTVYEISMITIAFVGTVIGLVNAWLNYKK